MAEHGRGIWMDADTERVIVTVPAVHCAVCGRSGWVIRDGHRAAGKSVGVADAKFGYSQRLGGPICSERCHRINLGLEDYLDNVAKGRRPDFYCPTVPVGVNLKELAKGKSNG